MRKETTEFIDNRIGLLRSRIAERNWQEAAGEFQLALGGLHALYFHQVITMTEFEKLRRLVESEFWGLKTKVSPSGVDKAQ